MKLNIGSSTEISGSYKNEWINIDLLKPSKYIKSYITASALQLPFRNNFFDEIRAIHCLEHMERKDHKLFYEEAYRTLKTNASIYIEVPNFYETCKIIIALYNTKNLDKKMEYLRIATLSVYGKGRHKGDLHRWGFTPELLKNDLENNNLKVTIETEMISNHYKQEPIILMKGTKE